jgi:hypothetical protein
MKRLEDSNLEGKGRKGKPVALGFAADTWGHCCSA